MTPLFFAVVLATPAASPVETEPHRVPATRVEIKEMLENSKSLVPRLPMPPADPSNPQARVNNGRFRSYYIPAELRESGGGNREPDPAMTLDPTFKVKLFWITSRLNNCIY